MDAYLTSHATQIRSEDQATRACVLLVEYMRDVLKDDTKPLSFWTPSQQKKFAEWLRDTFNHKAGTIERFFTVIAAAFADAAKVKMRIGPLGDEVEGVLVAHAPKIVYRRATIAKELKIAPVPKGGHFIPSMEEMAAFIDALETRHLRRWIILTLNTWGRPEAVSDFEPWNQVDGRTGLLHLNPPGRLQTNKHRPIILLTEGLRAWLPIWQEEDIARETEQLGFVPNEPIPLLVYKRERVKTVKRAILRIGDDIGQPKFTPYTVRRFMASTVRRLCKYVPRERRSMWLGHAVEEGSRTTDHYETFDAELLRDVGLATDFIISELQVRCATKVLATDIEFDEDELRRIGAKREVLYVPS